VQDGGDFVVLAGLPPLGVVIFVGRARQDLRYHERRVRRRGCPYSADAAGTVQHHAGLAAIGGEEPQRIDGVAFGAVRVGPG
jgi:hypothetical protein